MALFLALLAAQAVSIDDHAFVTFGDHRSEFETVVWAKAPGPEQLAAAFPKGRDAWVYAQYLCDGFTPDGGARGCEISVHPSRAEYEISRQALPLLDHYALSAADAARLQPTADKLFITLQIRFEGVKNWGNCGNYGFCTIVPPPPPPPPPPDRRKRS